VVEVLEVVDLNKQQQRELLNNKVKIKYTNIFPNLENSNYNTCIIFFEKDKIDYLLYAEKVKNTVNISVTDFYEALYTQSIYELTAQMLPEKNVVFRIIRLTPPKEITMKDIEKAFGGPVKIIE
jgi:hypothetical protein